ncbi:MAG TPA: hypothetical protein VFS08_13335 [Gemmatimonadaceae bacterium]|nr:hypothetical protein [Gemmatimonadaceae bacterium]
MAGVAFFHRAPNGALLMMAPDHSHGPTDGRFPSDETLALVRERLVAFLQGGQTAEEEEEVCEALARLAQEARDRRLHGEHVLLAVKTLWQNMAEVSTIRDSAERQRLLDRLVTLCIDIYYQRR